MIVSGSQSVSPLPSRRARGSSPVQADGALGTIAPAAARTQVPR